MSKFKFMKSEDHVLFKTQDGEYHLSLDEFNKLGEEKAKQLAISEIQKKQSSNYTDKTINFSQARDLGFCEYGIKDFARVLKLNIYNTYSIQELNERLTLEALKKYPEECIKLFGKNTFKYLGGIKGVLSPETINLVLRKEFIPENVLHELACKFAESVLHIFERKYPEDKRPRKAIEVKRAFIKGNATLDELGVARAAAEGSTRDAVWAAEDAAEDAVWAARAAWDAAEDAVWAARAAAEDAVWAARAAVRAAEDAVRAVWAARAVRAAEKEKQVELIKKELEI